ncbi:MAG: tetratricopeptide repeat protein [Terriglobales bacterium]
MRIRVLIISLALLTTLALAQDSPDKPAPGKANPDKASSAKANSTGDNANSNNEAQESSSHDTRIDLSPPKDDAKNHPGSEAAVEGLIPESADTRDNTGIEEFHPWSPMKALKDIEVGDFYFKRKNYKAALERYKEALYYKDNDAVASFRVATCQEKLGDKAEAKKFYEQYLKILPDGPLAKDARASLGRLAKAQ